MKYVNVSATVTKALTKVEDNSTELRALFVSWFNEVCRDILGQPRTWAFLTQTSTIPIVANQITLPDNTSEIVSLKAGSVFLTKANQISEQEAFLMQSNLSSVPVGFTLDANGVVTFYPSATGDCIAQLEMDMTTDYTDAETDTIFPLKLENLFLSGLRMHNYDYDKDGRYQKEVAIYQYEMSKIKAWDNLQKPKPKSSRHGYTKSLQ